MKNPPWVFFLKKMMVGLLFYKNFPSWGWVGGYFTEQSILFKDVKIFIKKKLMKIVKKKLKQLVGNKTDLENERKVNSEEGEKFAEENNYYFIETSCETNSNVSDAFEMIILSNSESKINKKLNKYINF